MIPLRDHNPYHRFPILTVLLIAANVYAFFAFGAAEDRIFEISERAAFEYGAVPCDLLGRCEALSGELERAFPDRGSILTVLTSMFMHGSILHLAFNMLFLWIFGNNVEDRLGRIRFALFYLLTGVAALVAQVAIAPSSMVPMVGASGAVSGILGAYVVLWPKARIVMFVLLGFIPLVFEVPAWFVIGYWFVVQVLGGVAQLGAVQEGGVAFFAHIGGFVAGFLLIRFLAPDRRRPKHLDELFRE